MTATSAETWDAIYRSGRAQRTWPSEDLVRFCARRLTTGMRVLEAGCGNGANLWYLVAEGYQVTGIDASSEAVKAALHFVSDRRLHPCAEIICGALGGLREAVTLDLPGRSPFDAIIDCRASQHTPWSQHAAIYREYFNLLKPGGWFFLLHIDDQTRPDAMQDTGETAGEQWTWDDIDDGGVYAHNGLVCMPPRQALRRPLTGAGFIVERQEQLLRITTDGVCAHTAFDCRKPKRAG